MTAEAGGRLAGSRASSSSGHPEQQAQQAQQAQHGPVSSNAFLCDTLLTGSSLCEALASSGSAKALLLASAGAMDDICCHLGSWRSSGCLVLLSVLC